MFMRWNERIRKLTVVDISLIKFSAMFFGVIVVKIFPALLKVNYSVLIALVLVCGLKPLHSFWFKK